MIESHKHINLNALAAIDLFQLYLIYGRWNKTN